MEKTPAPEKEKGKRSGHGKKENKNTEVKENKKKPTSLRLATIASESALPMASQQAEKAGTGQTYVF